MKIKIEKIKNGFIIDFYGETTYKKTLKEVLNHISQEINKWDKK